MRGLTIIGVIAMLGAIGYLIFGKSPSTIPPEPASSAVTLVTTAPDGTKLWGVQTRDGTVYFTGGGTAAWTKKEVQPSVIVQ